MFLVLLEDLLSSSFEYQELLGRIVNAHRSGSHEPRDEQARVQQHYDPPVLHEAAEESLYVRVHDDSLGYCSIIHLPRSGSARATRGESPK